MTLNPEQQPDKTLNPEKVPFLLSPCVIFLLISLQVFLAVTWTLVAVLGVGFRAFRVELKGLRSMGEGHKNSAKGFVYTAKLLNILADLLNLNSPHSTESNRGGASRLKVGSPTA